MKHRSPSPSAGEAGADLAHLADWIAQAAFPLGLTNYASPEDIMRRGVLPAYLLPKLLRREVAGSWAELGPGSGAIGLALACFSPAAHVTLVDRRARVTAYLDVSITRLSLPNATATTIALTSQPGPSWVGVCFRALAQPPHALQVAAAHARCWICAWHSSGMTAYDCPPKGFVGVARTAALADGLCATLYRRR